MTKELRSDGRRWDVVDGQDNFPVQRVRSQDGSSQGLVFTVPTPDGPTSVGVVLSHEDRPEGIEDYYVIDARPSFGPALPDELAADERARRVRELRSLIDPHRTRPPVPVNLFAVGVQGDYVVWLRPPAGKLHREEARNLAVWLAVLSNPTLETFLEELEAAAES